MIHSLLLPHGREVLRTDEDPKQVVEGVGLDEHLQASRIETQRTQRVGERGQHLASHWNL